MQLTRLVSVHATEEVERMGTMQGCACDMCAHAQKRLVALGVS